MFVYDNHVKSTVFSKLALLFKARTSYSGQIRTKHVLRLGSTNSLESREIILKYVENQPFIGKVLPSRNLKHRTSLFVHV